MEEKIWHKSYASGVKKQLEYEKMTISQALTRSAQKFPEKTALNYMGKRIAYKGEVPNPLNPPPGCRLQTRCPHETKQCRKEAPPLTEREFGHFAACWNR